MRQKLSKKEKRQRERERERGRKKIGDRRHRTDVFARQPHPVNLIKAYTLLPAP